MNAVPPLFAANPDNASAAYRNIRAADNANTRDGRQHCEDLWNTFAPLADDHFITEFPIRFHERWFEMYTGVSLLRRGFHVDSANRGPDFRLAVDGRRIWIECVCSTAGEEGHPDAVPEQEGAGWVPHDAIALRLRASLEVKAQKYQRYLDDGIVNRNDPLIIALNVHAVPLAWLDVEDNMMRAVYGRGNLVVTIDRDTGTITGTDYEQITAIPKVATTTEIGVRPFIDGSMGHVTGIIGSRADACNRPERLGDDFTFLPNLTAEQPWPGGIIQLGEEWFFEEAEDKWQGRRQSHMRGV